MHGFDILNPFGAGIIPVGDWVADVLRWVVANFRDYFQAIKRPIDVVLSFQESLFREAPQTAIIALITIVGWQIAGRATAILAFFCLLAIAAIGAWDNAMTTLALVLTAVSFCAVIGIPIGVAAARSDTFNKILRPLLDFMQTIPSFVYLVPIVMLFGIGNVPGVIVTIIYAMAPVIRLTNLGIRQVRSDLVEASEAFGASNMRTLFRVQIPLALPTIMTGVNQTVMMSLAMSVIASMISVTGLGQMVLRGIGRLDISLATTGGIGIVLIAIVVDRISQGFGRTTREVGHRAWYHRGPIRGLMALGRRVANMLRSAQRSPIEV